MQSFKMGKIKSDINSKSIAEKTGLISRIAWVCAGLVLTFIIATFFFNRGMDKIYALEIHNVDLSRVADGDYNGKYCEGRWCYDLTVIVKDHKLKDVRLNNDVMKMFRKQHSILTKRIIDKQCVNVDGISGTTITTKAFLKAVENAFDNQ
jgi:uncharacterized protein with FMN-binding domain